METQIPKGKDIRVQVRDNFLITLNRRGVQVHTPVFFEHVLFTWHIGATIHYSDGTPPWALSIAQLWFGEKTTQQERIDAIMAAADLCRLRFGDVA